jgi:hypothetical protein
LEKKWWKAIIGSVYAGAFVGMSSNKILNQYSGYIYGGILCGFVLTSLNGIFLIGGKFGFCAFISVNIIHLF